MCVCGGELIIRKLKGTEPCTQTSTILLRLSHLSQVEKLNVPPWSESYISRPAQAIFLHESLTGILQRFETTGNAAVKATNVMLSMKASQAMCGVVEPLLFCLEDETRSAATLLP